MMMNLHCSMHLFEVVITLDYSVSKAKYEMLSTRSLRCAHFANHQNQHNANILRSFFTYISDSLIL